MLENAFVSRLCRYICLPGALPQALTEDLLLDPAEGDWTSVPITPLPTVPPNHGYE